MAELLIMLRDNTHPDPVVDKRDCEKRGDIVIVKEDGHAWSPLEGLPTFGVVKLPGVSLEDAQHLYGSEMEGIGDLTSAALRRLPALARQVMKTRPRGVKRCRRYAVDADALALDAVGTVTGATIIDKGK